MADINDGIISTEVARCGGVKESGLGREGSMYRIDKVEEIDFLTGNDAYKQDWMSRRRERSALSCVKNARPTARRGPLAESLKRALGRR